jgi:pimeloyl-ACP methyl ester carboxylesterase
MNSSTTLRLPTDAGVAGLRRWGDGPPDVVLLHGAGGNRDSLAPLGDALAAHGLAVVAVSMPGRPGSDPEPVASIAEAADWLAALLRELAPGGTVLLGHSMGGGVAIETVLGTPARVRGLVLAATGARLRVHPKILGAAAEAVAAGNHLADISAAALRPDGPATARSHVLTTHALTPGPTALADWRATDGFDRLDDVGSLDLPVLVVTGEVDRLTPPKYDEYVVEHAPSAELVLLPGAGHWLPVEEAAQVADAVAAFVRRLVP